MAGPVISLTSSAQSLAAYERRLKEVEQFCRWIECAEVVKGWKPWFLGAFDHDLVTFAESREKAFAKFVLGNARCYERASMWSDSLNREIMPSDVVPIPAHIAKEWLMDEVPEDFVGHDLVLARESESWPAETLKPIVMAWGKNRWDMWVVEGTLLRNWGMVFMMPDMAATLVVEGVLAKSAELITSDEDYVTYTDIADVPSVQTVNGVELCYALIHFDVGNDFAYGDVTADPLGGE